MRDRLTERQGKPYLLTCLGSQTLSLHVTCGDIPVAKNGSPGSWVFEQCDGPEASEEVIDHLKQFLCEHATHESTTDLCEVYVYKQFRIVITHPPVSLHKTVTITQHIASKKLKEYTISPLLSQRLVQEIGGVLIAGLPGMGKTTLAGAFANEFSRLGKIVYTIESPRDLMISNSITQLSKDHCTHEELRKILLLSRPDYVIFDEMRSIKDMKLFADLRLAGIGVLGVIHGSKPVDAITRMQQTVDVGLMTHVIDTVIYVRDGDIAETLGLRHVVKVPQGISDSGQARPVVCISRLDDQTPLFELYSYGEGVCLIPVNVPTNPNVHKLVNLYVQQAYPGTMYHKETATIHAEKPTINRLKDDCCLRDLTTWTHLRLQYAEKTPERVPVEVLHDERYVTIHSPPGSRAASIYVEDTFLAHLKISENGTIRIKRNNALGDTLCTALKNNKPVLGAFS